jgi:hypothetical protein
VKGATIIEIHRRITSNSKLIILLKKNENVKLQTLLIKESENCRKLVYKAIHQHIGLAKI